MLQDTLRSYWHAVATSDDVTEHPLAIQLLDERLVLFRAGGQAHCFQDLCIHRGTPLSLGWVEGSTLVCAYHGWAYGTNGACVRIPSLPPEQGIPRKARVDAYQVQERYGLIWVCLGDTPAAPIPEFPEYDNPGYRTYYYGRLLMKSSAARIVENFMDQSHFPWVHDGILGDRSHALSPEHQIERRGSLLHYEYDLETPSLLVKDSVNRMIYDVTMPFTVRLGRRGRDGRDFLLFFTCLPHSAKEATRFLHVSRNFGLDEPDENFSTQTATVIEQDRIIVESQRPEELPLDLTEELHMKGPDSVTVEYRRMLAEIGVDAS